MTSLLHDASFLPLSLSVKSPPQCFVQENLGKLREDRKKWRRKRPRRRRQELRRIW
ncbi:unnamed protein product, partial [Brassica rapa subsp. trilocularis]